MASQGRRPKPDDHDLIGACGLYCGACYHYRASAPDGRHLLEEARRQGRNLQGFTCQGCRSSSLYIHPGCAQCQIRACTDRQGIDHCGLCAQFPCDRIQAFRNDGRIHHLDSIPQLQELAVQGPGLWLAAQANRWRCRCGSAYSWYETTCHTCGVPLLSYGPDPTITQLRDPGPEA